MKTNLITLVFYNSLVAKSNYRNTAVFQSCSSFSLIPPWSKTYWHFPSSFSGIHLFLINSFLLPDKLQLLIIVFFTWNYHITTKFMLQISEQQAENKKLINLLEMAIRIMSKCCVTSPSSHDFSCAIGMIFPSVLLLNFFYYTEQ